RTGDVKTRFPAVADAQIAESDPVRVHPNHTQRTKSSPVCIQFAELIEWRNLGTRALICEFCVMTHGACSGKSDKMLFSFAWQTPRSVIRPVTNFLGVTSKP